VQLLSEGSFGQIDLKACAKFMPGVKIAFFFPKADIIAFSLFISRILSFASPESNGIGNRMTVRLFLSEPEMLAIFAVPSVVDMFSGPDAVMIADVLTLSLWTSLDTKLAPFIFFSGLNPIPTQPLFLMEHESYPFGFFRQSSYICG